MRAPGDGAASKAPERPSSSTEAAAKPSFEGAATGNVRDATDLGGAAKGAGTSPPGPLQAAFPSAAPLSTPRRATTPPPSGRALLVASLRSLARAMASSPHATALLAPDGASSPAVQPALAASGPATLDGLAAAASAARLGWPRLPGPEALALSRRFLDLSKLPSTCQSVWDRDEADVERAAGPDAVRRARAAAGGRGAARRAAGEEPPVLAAVRRAREVEGAGGGAEGEVDVEGGGVETADIPREAVGGDGGGTGEPERGSPSAPLRADPRTSYLRGGLFASERLWRAAAPPPAFALEDAKKHQQRAEGRAKGDGDRSAQASEGRQGNADSGAADAGSFGAPGAAVSSSSASPMRASSGSPLPSSSRASASPPYPSSPRSWASASAASDEEAFEEDWSAVVESKTRQATGGRGAGRRGGRDEAKAWTLRELREWREGCAEEARGRLEGERGRDALWNRGGRGRAKDAVVTASAASSAQLAPPSSAPTSSAAAASAPCSSSAPAASASLPSPSAAAPAPSSLEELRTWLRAAADSLRIEGGRERALPSENAERRSEACEA